MSIDGKDKEESRFPKSSLRARSKTVMMEPSKLEGFRADSLWQDADMLNVDELLEDNVPATDDVDSVEGSAKVSSQVEHDVDGLSNQPLAVSEVQVQEGVVEDVRVEGLDGGEAERFAVEDGSEDDAFEEGAHGDLGDEALGVEVQGTEVPGAEVPDAEVPGAEVLGVEELGTEELSLHDSSGYKDFLEEGGSKVMERDSEFDDNYDQVGEDYDSLAHRDGDRIVWRRQTRLVGFLVALDASGGERYVELHEGRLLISSEQNATENCLVISHPSVSTMHAIMRISSDGSILILDQLSEHGTTIRRASNAREQSLMGDKEALHHGDVVVFGECAYNVCIIDFGVSKVDA